MMGVFDKFNDSPGQIRLEGQEIILKLQRTGASTARVSWNIPAPTNGCNADTQAYDGIVITVNSKPSNYISTSPKDGTYYNSDNTVDKDLHAGDKIDTALVIAALYHDKTTTFIDITDFQEKTAYYVSGYAVDNVGRYHREGVHAYSLPTGIQEFESVDTAAKHEIGLDTTLPITINQLTGLLATRSYTFKLKMNCLTYDITVDGANALTFKDLIDSINLQFALMMDPYEGPLPPNINRYYFDIINGKLYLWDGESNTEITVKVSSLDPSNPISGTYWLDTDTDILSLYSSTWVNQTVINTENRPDQPTCGQLWFDGTDVLEWEGDHWCKLCIYNQTTNPLLPPTLDCSTYWYNETESSFSKWDTVEKRWNEKLVILYDSDPNLLNTGDYWYNELDKKVYQFVGGTWNRLSNIRYVEPDVNGDLPSPATLASNYWFIPSEKILYQRDTMNIAWEERSFVSYPNDPRVRRSCDLWWNSDTDILYVWDEVNTLWLEIDNFFQTDVDPSLATTLPDCAVWYNPDTEVMIRITNISCDQFAYINSTVDPINLPEGTIWFDNSNYYVYTLVGLEYEWICIDVITTSEDPFSVTENDFWFDTNTDELKQYIASAWVVTAYSSDPLVPTVGTLWFDTVNDILKEWNGTLWAIAIPFATVSWSARTCISTKELLVFSTKRTGCGVDFEILLENDTLFSFLIIPVIYYDAINGNSGVMSGPMYEQLGVGTDGSPDERRKLHSDIRTTLGNTVVKVELTKEALDLAIDNALGVFRKRSGLSVTRGMFFLDLKPNQQTYILSNKCVGFNKIVNITSIHRMRSAAFKTAYASNDNFAYAALQQLYRLGTFDILTYHLSASYMEELEVLFATRIIHQWVERTRELKIYQSTNRERVLVDAVIERTEQDLITDRETKMWIQYWAVAEAKMMLSQSRGKFQTLPGPNGSTTLNASELAAQADAEKTALLLDLDDMNHQNAVDTGMRAHFIIG